MEIRKVEKPRRLYEDPAHVEELIPVSDLREYVDTHPYQGNFIPGRVFYNRAGDMLETYWADVECYAETMGDVILFRSIKTCDIVGVTIPDARNKVGLIEIPEAK